MIEVLFAPLLLAQLLLAPGLAVTQDRGPWNAHYQIDVGYDPQTHSVEGQAEIVFVNRTDDQVIDRLPFSLAPNAFRGPTTPWSKRSQRLFGETPLRHRGEPEYGYLRIDKVRRNGFDISSEVSIDETAMEIPLDPPLPPGESTAIIVDFKTKLPKLLDQMGHLGSQLHLFHWYPTLGVLKDGTWTPQSVSPHVPLHSGFASFEIVFIGFFKRS